MKVLFYGITIVIICVALEILKRSGTFKEIYTLQLEELTVPSLKQSAITLQSTVGLHNHLFLSFIHFTLQLLVLYFCFGFFSFLY